MPKSNRMGQASLELIAILGITLLGLLIFTVLASDLLSGLTAQKKYSDVYDGVHALANAADSVYSQGEGSAMIVKITLPPGTSMDPEYTFIGKPASADASVAPNNIVMKVENMDVFATTNAPLSGSFPSSKGTHLVKVVSKGNYVVIGEYLFEGDKESVFKSMARDESRSETITLTSYVSHPISMNVSYAQSYDNAVITIPQSEFVLLPASNYLMNITLTSNAYSAGIYNWELKFEGTSQVTGSRNEFEVPITMEVRT